MIDMAYRNRFLAEINDDLNLPRAMAVTWELVKSDLSSSTKKATLLEFDRVLGLHLAEWRPTEAVAPPAIMMLMQQHQARVEGRWQDADTLREQVRTSGYDIDDTPHGPRLRSRPARREE
jgi:cysteinyl-tRNA synthetase